MQTLIQDQTFNIQRDGGYRKKSHCDFLMTIFTREWYYFLRGRCGQMLFIRKGWRVNCPIYLRSPHPQDAESQPHHQLNPCVYVSTYAVTASWIVYCPLLFETDEKSPFEPRVCAKSNWNASKIRANFQKQLAQCHFGLLAVGSVVSENTTRLYLLTSTRKEMRTSSQIFLPSQISNQYNNDSAFVF